MERFREENPATPYLELINQADELMRKIDIATNSGNTKQVKNLSLRAASVEEKALGLLPRELTITRALVGSHAVSLYYDAKYFEDATRLGIKLLGELDPQEQDDSMNDINCILDSIYEETHKK